MMRMLRPDWGPKYIAGNPNGNRFECYLSELEDWERIIPCERCDGPDRCTKSCHAYDKWLLDQPLKRKYGKLG